MIKATNKLTGKTNASIIKVYPELEELEVNPTLEEQELTPDKYGFSKVLVNGIPATDLEVTATEEEQVAEGIFKKVYVNSIPTEEKTIEPDFNNVDQIEITPTEESYLKKVTLIKDIDLDPANIKKGRNIFGIDGEFDAVDTRDATATTNDIVEGTTAYVNNEKIEGNVPNNGVLEYTPSDEEQAIPAGLTAGGAVLPADITTLSEYEKCLTIANSIEDMSDYSDTTATPEDIVEGKTAYSNGERITGTMQVNDNNAKMVDVDSIYTTTFSFKYIINKLDFTNVDFKNMKKFSSAFAEFQYLEEIKGFYPQNAIEIGSLCYRCYELHTINEIDTSKLNNAGHVLGGAFESCPKLSDESLNNILAMCTNAKNLYPEYRTLKHIGLTSAQVTRCQSLPNWQAFVDAGLTTGY